MRMWVIVYEGDQVREEHIFTGSTISELYNQYYDLCLSVRYMHPGWTCKIIKSKDI